MNLKRFFKPLTIMLVTGTIFIFSSINAFGHWYQYGYNLYSFTYSPDSGSDYWAGQAAKNWRDKAGTTITKSTYSNNTVSLANYNYSWYGLYTPYTNSSGGVYKFSIKANTYALQDDYTNWDKALISTLTHEFGHAQYLNDLESGWGNLSIMSYERNRETILTPQAHDINDLNNYRN